MATGRVPADSNFVCPCPAFSTIFEFVFWIKSWQVRLIRSENGAEVQSTYGHWFEMEWRRELERRLDGVVLLGFSEGSRGGVGEGE
jgi:hypothetical protein